MSEKQATDIRAKKAELRRFVREQKKRYSTSQLTSMSMEICDKVLRSACWREAQTVLLYHPLAGEVDVRPLIDEAYGQGKTVLLPVCVGDELELRLYEGESSLDLGSFGIMEPTGKPYAEEWFSEVDLAILPGMAYDKKGHRLGRGKGYYDRLVYKLVNARLQGVCFPFQFLDEVPAEVHDIAVADVLTTNTSAAFLP